MKKEKNLKKVIVYKNAKFDFIDITVINKSKAKIKQELLDLVVKLTK